MAKGMSVHVGLNSVDPRHYDGWKGELIACENDAKSMCELASSKNFFAKVLKTNEATRSNVTQAIKEAAQLLKSGDYFLLTYSGHGGQLPDANRDEDDDNLDETWVLFDGQLLDDEIFDLLAQFEEGVRVLVLSDSCHSGSVTKDLGRSDPGTKNNDGLHYKFMPREVAIKTYRANKEFYSEIETRMPQKSAEPKASILLISGCQDNQLSLDGWENSLFTEALLLVWDNGNFHGNYASFYEAIVNSIHPACNQRPNYRLGGAKDTHFEGQSPFTI